ncbi:hypothetical protein [Streptomyces sp. NBC_00690]|uniref:hypothetical protein n=1 Tax=Streptomyces sp. NBC_00690 TaxID=2975808 RepID=UPI002E2E0CCC|nr:hypothetical protein [Streptomyces sp. NBC_00690]
MAAKRTTTRRIKPVAPAPCPDCKGAGETAETVRIGARKGRETDHRQTVLCLSCLGTGLAT